jgi:hypothetical protein
MAPRILSTSSTLALKKSKLSSRTGGARLQGLFGISLRAGLAVPARSFAAKLAIHQQQKGTKRGKGDHLVAYHEKGKTNLGGLY